MDNSHNITDLNEAVGFVYGGKARFTLKSLKTGKHYTYRVAKSKEADHLFFVRVLTNGDNDGAYSYAGFLNRAQGVVIQGAKGLPSLAKARAALTWFLKHAATHRDQMPDELEFWHEGRCARCAHPLTDPESIARGFGPECATHIGE